MEGHHESAIYANSSRGRNEVSPLEASSNLEGCQPGREDHDRRLEEDTGSKRALNKTHFPRLQFDAPATSSEEEEEKIKVALNCIANSFSHSIIHMRLLDLAIGRCSVHKERIINLPPAEPLCLDHIHSMSAMVEMEFLASLEKELNAPDEKILSEPLPFDVFLMAPSLFRGNNLTEQLALYVPTKKWVDGKRVMMWYNGKGELWDPEQQIHARRVASLSGTARILETLISCRTPMMEYAISREMIVDMNEEYFESDSCVSTTLNESQQDAVSVVSSPQFTEGIFCVLGMYSQ